MTNQNLLLPTLIEKIRDDLTVSLCQFMLEPNTPDTWFAITKALNDTVARYHTSDHVVICNENINSSDTNTLLAEVAIKLPDRPDFFYLPIHIEAIIQE